MSPNLMLVVTSGLTHLTRSFALSLSLRRLSLLAAPSEWLDGEQLMLLLLLLLLSLLLPSDDNNEEVTNI